MINHQANALIEDIEARNVDPYEGFAYLRTLLHQKNLLTHTKQRFLSIQMLLMSIVRFFRELKNRFLALLNNESMKENLMQHQVRMICEQEAIRYLHSLVDNPNYPSEVVAKLLIAHERVLAAMRDVLIMWWSRLLLTATRSSAWHFRSNLKWSMITMLQGISHAPKRRSFAIMFLL